MVSPSLYDCVQIRSSASFAAAVLPDIVIAGPLLGFRDGLDLCFLHGHVVGYRSLEESKLQKNKLNT